MSESPPIDVVIVEDETRLRDLLVRMLRELGHAAQAFAAAEPALRHLASGDTPTVAIVDLNLPGIGGLSLIQRLRDARRPVAVIVLTGFGSLNAAQEAIRLQVVDFLTKPCTLGDLEQALGRALAKLAPPVPRIEPDLPQPPPAGLAPRRMEQVERQHIEAALSRHGGNRRAAARDLGISLRKLYYRLREYRNA